MLTISACSQNLNYPLVGLNLMVIYVVSVCYAQLEKLIAIPIKRIILNRYTADIEIIVMIS